MSSSKVRRTSAAVQQKAKRKSSVTQPPPPAGDGVDSSVAVAVRVRPFLPRELEMSQKCIVGMRGQEAWVSSDTGNQHRFTFDHAFWSFDGKGTSDNFSSQQAVYEKLARPLLDCSFEGYNTCLFAYGQTGSGKSYCMMGEKEDRGVIPRFGDELFERIIRDQSAETTYKVEISFYEIYNERIHDLLASSKGRAKPLRVREHTSLGPFVEDLSSYVASSNEDLQGWVNLGNKHRATAATGMNDKSSRSHSVFMIVLTQTKTLDEQEVCRTSRINLVDLAGSERTGKAGTTGERLKEGASINKSLHTLGKVISALCERSISRKKVFIPYRDSSLTWLLKESLGGNAKTAMIATVSPAPGNYDESLSTLRYADQARSIVNVARVNEDATSKLIRELREEIDRLRSQFSSASLDASSLEEVQRLREKLKTSEKLMTDHTRSWQEKLQEAETRKEEQAAQLKKHGVSFKVDNRLPNLVNLNEDPQLSEMLLYVIKQGRTTVGQESSETAHDIHLSGALVTENHCVLENDGETVKILPMNDDAQTYVNGELIGDGVTLHHGDRVVIGGDYFFRFNHPVELAKHPERRSTASAPKGGFEFAQDELFEVQDARLRAEVEEARLKAHEEAMEQIAAAKEVAQREMDENRQVFECELLSVKGQLLAESTDKKQVMQQSEQKLESLEAEKRALEAQVIAHRHQLEMDREKLRKVFEEDRQQKTNLIADLENERRKLEEDVVKLKKSKEQRATLNEIMATPEKMASSTGQSKRLMRYYMMLTEANNIGESLKKSTSFFIESVLDGEPTQIRVQNTKLGISTIWPVSKFEQRLEKMRELFQGEGEGVDDNDVFYDPKDDWKKSVAASPLPMTPAAISQPRSLPRRTSSVALQDLPPRIPKSLADLLQSAVTPSSSSRPSSRAGLQDASPSLSFLTTNRARFDSAFASSPGSASAFSSTSMTPTTHAFVSNPVKSLSRLAGTSRQHVAAMLDMLPVEGVSRTSVADRIVTACCDVRRSTVDVQLVFQKITSGTVTATSQESLQSAMLHFSSACQCLADGVTAWKRLEECRRLHDRKRRNPHMLKTMDSVMASLQREVRSVCMDVTRLLQGVENDIDTVVSDSASKILIAVNRLVKLAGQASLATAQSPLLVDASSSLDGEASEETSVFDSLSLFLCGASEYVDRTLQSMKATVTEGHQQIAELRENQALQTALPTMETFLDGVSSVLTGLKGFLDALQSLQSKLLSCGSSGVSFSYRRAEQLLHQLSLLYVDVLALPRATNKAFLPATTAGHSSGAGTSSSLPSPQGAEKLISAMQSAVVHAVDTAAACKPQLEALRRRSLSASPSNLSQESDASDLSESTVASNASGGSGSASVAGQGGGPGESEDLARMKLLADALPAIESAAKDVARAAKSLTAVLRHAPQQTQQTQQTQQSPAVLVTRTEMPLSERNPTVKQSSPKSTASPNTRKTSSPKTGKTSSPKTGTTASPKSRKTSSPKPGGSGSSPLMPARQRRQLPSLDVVRGTGGSLSPASASPPVASSAQARQRASLGSTGSSGGEPSPAPHQTKKRRLPRSPSTPTLDATARGKKSAVVEEEV